MKLPAASGRGKLTELLLIKSIFYHDADLWSVVLALPQNAYQNIFMNTAKWLCVVCLIG